MKHLITATLAAAMLAAPAFADKSMSPEEFYEAQADCNDSRNPTQCYVARYRNASRAQVEWFVELVASNLEEDDQYAAANYMRHTYETFSQLSSPGEALYMAVDYSRMKLVD